MSPRPKRLLLNDRRWLSLATAHPLIYRLTGDCYAVARDMTDALAYGRLRSMRRQRNGGGPDRELLSSSFWAEHKIESGHRENFDVIARGQAALTIYGVFYVWEPDYKKIVQVLTTQVEPRTPPPEGLENAAKSPLQSRQSTVEGALEASPTKARCADKDPNRCHCRSCVRGASETCKKGRLPDLTRDYRGGVSDQADAQELNYGNYRNSEKAEL